MLCGCKPCCCRRRKALEHRPRHLRRAHSTLLIRPAPPTHPPTTTQRTHTAFCTRQALAVPPTLTGQAPGGRRRLQAPLTDADATPAAPTLHACAPQKHCTALGPGARVHERNVVAAMSMDAWGGACSLLCLGPFCLSGFRRARRCSVSATYALTRACTGGAGGFEERRTQDVAPGRLALRRQAVAKHEVQVCTR